MAGFLKHSIRAKSAKPIEIEICPIYSTLTKENTGVLRSPRVGDRIQ